MSSTPTPAMKTPWRPPLKSSSLTATWRIWSLTSRSLWRPSLRSPRPVHPKRWSGKSSPVTSSLKWRWPTIRGTWCAMCGASPDSSARPTTSLSPSARRRSSNGAWRSTRSWSAIRWATGSVSTTGLWSPLPALWRRSTRRRTRSPSSSPCSGGRLPSKWSWSRWSWKAVPDAPRVFPGLQPTVRSRLRERPPGIVGGEGSRPHPVTTTFYQGGAIQWHRKS